MKMKAQVPLPLGQYDSISSDTARSLIGKTFPAKIEGRIIGEGVITDVEWRDSNDVILIIEMDVSDGTGAI